MNTLRILCINSIRWIGRRVQWVLDRFYDFRSFLLNCIAFLSLRIYAIEVSFRDVKEGKYSEDRHENRNLDNAKDLEALLVMAKDCYKAAGDRRNMVTDKCKTLLTMSTFILAISGIFLPKPFDVDGSWFRYLIFVAGFLVLDAVVLLLVYFGIGAEQKLSLEQHIVHLDKDDLKKALVNEYLSCEMDSENRTSYLVDVYKTARFFALVGFLLMLVLAATNFLSHSPSATAKQTVEELKKDPLLVDLLRGSKGMDGPKGDQGVQGPMGNTGPMGPKGEPGMMGPKGDKGDRGEKGG